MDIEGQVNSTIGLWEAEVHIGQRVSSEFVENRGGVKGIKLIEESTDSCSKAIKISAKLGL
jgi:hypothetical protein